MSAARTAIRIARMLSRWLMRRSQAQVLRLGGLALAYFATARIGLTLDAVSGVATAVWPPTGISLAVLLLYGTGLWPGVTLGAFAANFSNGVPPAPALAIAVGNTLEAVVGAALLRRAGLRNDLQRIRDVLALVLLAALASTVISATVGTLTTLRGGLGGRAADVWTAWWLGDLSGDLLFAPPILVWATAATERRRRPVEAAALGLGLLLVSAIVFGAAAENRPLHLSYLFFPVLIWAALRFGQRGAVSASLAVALVAIWATAVGRGPFAGAPRLASLLSLQAFMAVVSTTLMVLGSAIEERARSAEAERRLVDELERAVRARDDFVAVAGHELKTPLTTLGLQIARLERARDRETGADAIDAAQRMVARLGRMIEDLLDVTRIRTGRLTLTIEEVDLSAIAVEVAGRFRDDRKRTGGPIEVATPGPVVGSWDRTRIEQIVTNLVSNAVKYGARNPIEVRIEREGARARLRVRDRGIGIEPEQQARIFERFERAVSGKHYGGLGLGLWIVRQIVDALGGTIAVDSTPGEGAQFTVELPLRPPARG
jgi:signal transduction histidine kinase